MDRHQRVRARHIARPPRSSSPSPATSSCVVDCRTVGCASDVATKPPQRAALAVRRRPCGVGLRRASAAGKDCCSSCSSQRCSCSRRSNRATFSSRTRSTSLRWASRRPSSCSRWPSSSSAERSTSPLPRSWACRRSSPRSRTTRGSPSSWGSSLAFDRRAGVWALQRLLGGGRRSTVAGRHARWAHRLPWHRLHPHRRPLDHRLPGLVRVPRSEAGARADSRFESCYTGSCSRSRSSLLHRSGFGRITYVVGAAADVARFSGVRVRRHKAIIFAMSGFIAALAGVLYAAHLGAVRGQHGRRFRAGHHHHRPARRRQHLRWHGLDGRGRPVDLPGRSTFAMVSSSRRCRDTPRPVSSACCSSSRCSIPNLYHAFRGRLAAPTGLIDRPDGDQATAEPVL